MTEFTTYLPTTFVMDGVSHDVNGRLTLSRALFETVATELTITMGDYLLVTWKPDMPMEFSNNSAEGYGNPDHPLAKVTPEVMAKQIIPAVLMKLKPDVSSI